MKGEPEHIACKVGDHSGNPPRDIAPDRTPVTVFYHDGTVWRVVDLHTRLIDALRKLARRERVGLNELLSAATRAIEEFSPDVFIIDPWNRATADDKSKDYLETFNRILSLLPTGDKAPALGIVAHTRKPAAGERTNGRALLNVLAGGYALGSVPRSAFVIQHASDEPTETRVVFTCCKNNDGELGEPTAWQRCNGLFQPVDGFDWDEFHNPGEKRKGVTAEDLEAIFSDGENGWLTITRGEAVNLLIERTKLGRTACYNALEFTGKFKSRLKEKAGSITLK